MTELESLERCLALAHRRLDRRDAGLPPQLPGDPQPLRQWRDHDTKEAA